MNFIILCFYMYIYYSVILTSTELVLSTCMQFSFNYMYMYICIYTLTVYIITVVMSHSACFLIYVLCLMNCMYRSIWFSTVESHSGYKISLQNHIVPLFSAGVVMSLRRVMQPLRKFEGFVLMHFNYLKVVHVSFILFLSHKSATLVASGWV